MSHKQSAQAAFDADEAELREISRWMYENPELAYEEHESSRRLSDFLTARGFDVTFPAHGLDTAFEATVGESGPRVIVCAEYDALPGVGHACGHNIIATAAVGAGAAVADLADQLGIRVTVLGTPAEESGGGKIDLINAGAFEDCAAAMMIHPGPGSMLDPELLAVGSYIVEYFGKESHASFAPQEGINALDAMVLAYNTISTLRQQLRPTDQVHGIITHGGQASNVVPAYTRSEWGVRAPDGSRLEELMGMVKACFEAAAQASGCDLKISSDGHVFVDLKTNPVMGDLFAANSAALGRPLPRREDLGYPAGGSSDMGNVSQVVPSIHPGIGIETDAVNHQPGFAAATITPSGDQALRDGALAMAHTIIDMAEQNVWDRL